MDPLADVFASLNVRTGALCGFETTGSWKLGFPSRDQVKIGVVLSGTFLLAADDATPVELGAGDCFLLAARDTYVLATDWSAPTTDGEQVARDSPTRVVVLGAGAARDWWWGAASTSSTRPWPCCSPGRRRSRRSGQAPATHAPWDPCWNC